MTGPISRRNMVASLGASAGGLLLGGCDRINRSPAVQHILGLGEKTTFKAQRTIIARNALAPEYAHSQMSPFFRTNGNVMASLDDYQAHLANGFSNWRLVVDGLVARPLSLSLAQLHSAPRRTQITRHDCVEGWSAIGQWTGTPLGLLLRVAGISPAARYIVFHCADTFGDRPYYESIDLVDAFHPQTILAWGMNGQTLPTGHGAPIRLRVERMLGYKHAKFVMRVEAVASLAGLHGGQGGYWEDVADYQWYAGI